MKKSVLLLLFVLSTSFSFSQTIMHTTATSYVFRNDTLFSMLPKCSGMERTAFYDYHGYAFDFNYKVIDSLRFDINNDHIDDMLVVLSTKDQEKLSSKASCFTANKRLLLILVSKNNKFKIKCINENCILNTYDSQSDPFRKMQKSGNEIILSFLTGSSKKCYHNFYFHLQKGNLLLRKDVFNCYLIDLSKSRKGTHIYNNIKIDDFNVHSMLKTYNTDMP